MYGTAWSEIGFIVLKLVFACKILHKNAVILIARKFHVTKRCFRQSDIHQYTNVLQLQFRSLLKRFETHEHAIISRERVNYFRTFYHRFFPVQIIKL